MNNIKDKRVFPKYACQNCGCDRKLVETVIDDEFVWNEKDMRYEPVGFTDYFDHTGFERCAECNAEWSGFTESELLNNPSTVKKKIQRVK